MLKTFVDFLLLNWQAFLQAPVAFIVASVIGFATGLAFLKNQNDALKERLQLKEDKLKDKDAENLKLNEEVLSLKAIVNEAANTTAKNLLKDSRTRKSYEAQISEYCNIDLSKEAYKMAEKLGRSIQLAKERQDVSTSLDVGMYNEWLSEGSKLLAIKHEALKRLPSDAGYQIDRVSDSRYTNPAFDLESILDAVSEINAFAEALSKLTGETNL